MPVPEASETQTIKIPKKLFGIVSGIVSFLMLAGGLAAKGCDMHRKHILKEKEVELRLKSLERWKCAMGSKHDPKDIDWRRVCQPSVKLEDE